MRALRDAYRDLVVGVLRDGTADGTFVPGDQRLRSLQMFGSLHWMSAGPCCADRGVMVAERSP